MKILLYFIFIFNYTLIFSNDFESRIIMFISEGFGFNYDLIERSDINIFLLNHGEPVQIIETTFRSRYAISEYRIIILEYDYIIATFCELNETETILLSFKSKENIEYIFGIKHGMDINDLITIFGEINIRHNNIVIFRNSIGLVSITFENNKLNQIEWVYGLIH